MRNPLSRFFVTLAFTPLLGLYTRPLQAQELTDVFQTEGRTDLQRLTETLTSFGKRESRPTPLGVEILSLDARNLLLQLDETRPDEGNSFRVRDLLERLQKTLATYTRSGLLDEASVLREHIEEFLAMRAGVEPDPGNLTTFRDQVGKTHMFRVMGHRTGSVWGNHLYTDDSDLGAAAVHAGLLREGQRGVVKVTLLPGQDHYEGTLSNGITSSSYETWQGSYTIAPVAMLKITHDATMPEEAKNLVEELTRPEAKVSADRLWQGMDSLQKLQETAQQAEELDEALALREGIRALIVKMAGANPDPGALTSLRGQIGKSFYFVVTGKATGSLWGSEVYTDDSDLGTVAVHAGLLRPGQRGIIKVTIRPGYEGYGGSESNGVVSGSYGIWQGSYQVSAFRLPTRKSLPRPK